MKIAIIGGGIGGLAVAYELVLQASQNGQPKPDLVVIEAQPRLGGNADTMTVNFGEGPNGPVERWVDLGVNDFNATAYTEIVKVMNQIGFTFGVDYKPLEDSTSYYSADGSLFFTDNEKPWWGTGIPADLAKTVAAFMKTAGNDVNDPKYHTYTLEQYITEKSATLGWDARLGPWVIYPRVNGMYFTSSELGPRKMPFYAVMHYYKIQESAGTAKAQRNYFVNGSSHWISALTGYMAQKMGISMLTNFRATVAQNGAGWTITDANGAPPIAADIVVLATHANDALRLMQDLPPPVANIMAQITYETAVSVAHVDSRLLPVDYNAWCTYNILIHEPGSAAMHPYVINYVANRHQNDAVNPAYDAFGLPQFFVSVNPFLPIPEDMVLKDDQGKPAMAYLHHNVFDFPCMQAQAAIDPLQGQGNLYYAGGWTHGSGLHEECWQQGIDIAGKILTHIQCGTPAAHPPSHWGDLVRSRLLKTASS